MIGIYSSWFECRKCLNLKNYYHSIVMNTNIFHITNAENVEWPNIFHLSSVDNEEIAIWVSKILKNHFSSVENTNEQTFFIICVRKYFNCKYFPSFEILKFLHHSGVENTNIFNMNYCVDILKILHHSSVENVEIIKNYPSFECQVFFRIYVSKMSIHFKYFLQNCKKYSIIQVSKTNTFQNSI